MYREWFITNPSYNINKEIVNVQVGTLHDQSLGIEGARLSAGLI